jgi:hypothetical protein
MPTGRPTEFESRAYRVSVPRRRPGLGSLGKLSYSFIHHLPV